MIHQSSDIPIIRGCGRRDPGGIYIMSKLGIVGYPWWYWLSDPPMPIPPTMYAQLRLNDRGSQLVKRLNYEVYDVWDIVGQGRVSDPAKGKGYWNVLDYAIEVNYAGASRKVSPSLPMHLLSRESRLVLLHRRACILNWHTYLDAIGNGDVNTDGKPNDSSMHPNWECVKGMPQHMTPTQPLEEQCASLWFHDVEGGEPLNPDELDEDVWHVTRGGVSARTAQAPRLTPVVRRMPAFTYYAWARPTGIEPKHELGIFMTLPINGIDVIRDSGHGQHEKALKVAQRGPFEVTLCEA